MFEVAIARGGLQPSAIEFYSAADHSAPNDGVRFPRIFLARLTPANAEGSTWASSADCPAMFGVLEELQRLQAGSYAVTHLYGVPPEGVRRYPRLEVGPDGDSEGVMVWGQGRQPSGEMATISVASSGGVMRSLADFAMSSLEACWRR